MDNCRHSLEALAVRLTLVVLDGFAGLFGWRRGFYLTFGIAPKVTKTLENFDRLRGNFLAATRCGYAKTLLYRYPHGGCGADRTAALAAILTAIPVFNLTAMAWRLCRSQY